MLRTWTSIPSATKSRVTLLALILCVGVSVAQAQTPPPDVFQVNYFAGANGSRPDQTVRITNPGTAVTGGNATADLCANIYVFRADQQMTECCSCLVTPNGLRTLSVDFDLAHNPLTDGAIGEGVIKLVSSPVPTDGCVPSTAGSTYGPVAALRAWGVHNQDVSGGLQGTAINQVTETEFLGSRLSEAELSELQNTCRFIVQFAHGGFPPSSVTYITSGSYNGGGSSITFGGGANTLTLSFQGVNASPSPPTNISLGDVVTSVTGSGNTIPVGTTLTINIGQISPTSGGGVLAGQLTGTISQNSASFNSQIDFNVTSVTIFGVTYTIINNPYTLVPPAVNNGHTTIQAFVVASAAPGICSCGRGD